MSEDGNRAKFVINTSAELVEEWREIADDHYNTRTKFGIEMIQSGLREQGLANTYENQSSGEVEIDDIDAKIKEIINERQPVEFDEIVSAVSKEVLEEQVENTLISDSQIVRRPTEGGYIIEEQ